MSDSHYQELKIQTQPLINAWNNMEQSRSNWFGNDMNEQKLNYLIANGVVNEFRPAPVKGDLRSWIDMSGWNGATRIELMKNQQ